MKENTKRSDSLPYGFMEEPLTNNEQLEETLEEKLERLIYQASHATAEHLPPLVSINDIYEGKNSEPECEEFDIKEIGERLEDDLLQIPDFQPPHTATDKPAHILSYNVIPEPNDMGVFTAYLDFLPGDKVPQYYKKLLKQLGVASQSDNGTSAKRQKA